MGVKKLIEMIKWRLEYLAGKKQEWHQLPPSIDIGAMPVGTTLYFRSSTNPSLNGIWVVR